MRSVRSLLARLMLAVMAVGALGVANGAGDFASTRAAPRVEHWQRRQAAIEDALKDSQSLAAVRLVFIGDSITDFWLLDDNPWVKGQKYGLRVWNESFAGAVPENRALNLGISGDRIEHVLYRLLPRPAGGLGQLDAPGLKPDFLIVMLGINNTWAAEEPVADSLFEGVRSALIAMHDRQPQARIVLQSLLPTQDEAKNRDVVRPVNQRLAALADRPPFAGFTSYLDLYPAFVDPTGRQIDNYFTDGLHPNAAGYRVWRDALVPFLQQTRASMSATPTGKQAAWPRRHRTAVAAERERGAHSGVEHPRQARRVDAP